jgi:hypothetical protein
MKIDLSGPLPSYHQNKTDEISDSVNDCNIKSGGEKLEQLLRLKKKISISIDRQNEVIKDIHFAPLSVLQLRYEICSAEKMGRS